MERFKVDRSTDGHPIVRDGEVMTKNQLLSLLNEMQECIDMADGFYSEVLPQAGKMVFQDYGKLNSLGISLSKLKTGVRDER